MKTIKKLEGPWSVDKSTNTIKRLKLDKKNDVDLNQNAIKGKYRIKISDSWALYRTHCCGLYEPFAKEIFYYVSGKDNGWTTIGEFINSVYKAYNSPLPEHVKYRMNRFLFNKTEPIRLSDIKNKKLTWLDWHGDHRFIDQVLIKKYNIGTKKLSMFEFGFGS